MLDFFSLRAIFDFFFLKRIYQAGEWLEGEIIEETLRGGGPRNDVQAPKSDFLLAVQFSVCVFYYYIPVTFTHTK